MMTPGENASESGQERHDERARRLTPAMRGTLIAVAALVVVGLAAAVWLMAPSGGGMLGDAARPSPTATATAAPTPGPQPGAAAVDGSEVLPPATQAPGAPGDGDAGKTETRTLPPVDPGKPLVTGDLPEPAAASGSLVEGFPAQAAPAPESDVIQSSIATEGNIMQVSLVARTDKSAADVTAHYRDAWRSLGLGDRSTEGGLQYADSFTTLTLAFSSGSGTGTMYTVYGVFHTS